MKILNIFEVGNFGGPQKRALLLARELKKYNVETVFLIPADSYFPETEFRTIRIDLHRITKDKKHLTGYISLFPYETYKIYEIIKKESPDLIYCNGAWQFKGVVAGKLARKKIIWHLNDTFMPWIIRTNFRILSKFADGFIIAGERAEEFWRSLIPPNKQVLTLNAPVDVEKEYNPELVQEDEFISKFKGIKIVNVSNINPIKGLEYFIKMAHLLNKRHDNLVFFIVGRVYPSQRKYFKSLRKLASQLNLKNLYFYTDAERINAVLKSTDIFVFTSLSEASPLAVWEAMAMGLPIVSTDVGDVARFVEDNINGFVVKPKDIIALTEKVSILINDPSVAEKFSITNRKISVQEFNISKISSEMYFFLKKM